MQLQDLSNSQHACQWGKSSAISSSKSNRTLNARAFTQFTEGGAPKADPCITADLSPLWINDNKFWQKYKTCLCWSRRDCGHAQFPVSPDCWFFFYKSLADIMSRMKFISGDTWWEHYRPNLLTGVYHVQQNQIFPNSWKIT